MPPNNPGLGKCAGIIALKLHLSGSGEILACKYRNSIQAACLDEQMYRLPTCRIVQ